MHVKGANTIVFTDNNVVKAAPMSGVAVSLPNRSMLNIFAVLDIELGGRTWITRVPSASNPADNPSRFCGDLLREWLPLVRDTE
eukprot:1142772-Amphidinium_carterae.1